MQGIESCPHTRRFGVFEVDLRAAELRKRGVRIKLQEQPFRMPVQLVGDKPLDVLLRLRLDLAQIDLVEAARLRKIEMARAEEEVIGHEERLRLALGVVPVFEPGVDFLAPP